MRANKALRDYIRKTYPSDAVVVCFSFNSEYNDQGYDSTVASAIVRDRAGKEVRPTNDDDPIGKDRVLKTYASGYTDTILDRDYDYGGPDLSDYEMTVLVGE